LGSIAFVKHPFFTMSILEPDEPGGCKMEFFSASRSTVSATSSKSQRGCKLALNAGYFSVANGQCLGNIVSDGRIVQSTGEQNANFGVRQDGTIVVGYISEEEILDGSYRQLISGVLWLVRNGTNYVNESMGLECASHQDTGKMSSFVEVLSARTAIGHDSEGRIVVAYVSV
jgi:exopolysaccharide biosynthesis protein